MGYALPTLTKPELVEPMYRRFSVQSLDDLYAMVGFGGLSTQQVLNRLVEEYRKSHRGRRRRPPRRRRRSPRRRRRKPPAAGSASARRA